MRAVRAAQAFDGSAFVGPTTVLVEGESIVGVERGHPDLPDGVEVSAYDGTLLPGLFDCHVHLVSDSSLGSLEAAGTSSDEELDATIVSSLRAEAAGGVTTVQDLGDRRYRTLRVRSVPGLPRVLASGPPITVPGGHCHYLGGEAEGVDGVRRAVDEHVAQGVDVLKVMASGGMLTVGTDTMAAQFTPAELRAVVEAGHAAGLRVLAHAHALAGVWQALECGVDGIEHFSCLTDQGPVTPDALLEAVAAAGVVVDPTLGVDPAGIPSPDLLPPGFRATMERMGLDHTTYIATRLAQVGRVRRHGITVVTGTDAGAGPPKPHGHAWRAVLALVEAGYPIDEALATATSGAADVHGLADVTGRLRSGLAADLLVVDGDLTTDPQALGHPVVVLVRGAQAS
jgi:imidazolonepropionase-like amidohydrolase